MIRSILFVALFAVTGCTHHQLRYNTTNQARTVADIHTQQVLDNLAKFAQNPEALPHFAYPQGGATSVNDSLGQAGPGFDFSPHALNKWTLGFSGNRAMSESYTLVPLNDPRKLELMRCAYQKAVQGQCNCGQDGCSNCIYRFNDFYLGEESPGKIALLSPDNKPIHMLYTQTPDKRLPAQEQGGTPYVRDKNDFDETIFRALYNRDTVLTKSEADDLEKQELFFPIFVDNSISIYTQRTGKTTIECVESGWFRIGKKKDFKKLGGCCPVGSYCGTYVCVPPENLDQLSSLTMVILDIALNDPSELPDEPTKEVITYLDSKGNVAESRDQSAFEVKQTIPESESPVPPSTVASAQTERKATTQARVVLNIYNSLYPNNNLQAMSLDSSSDAELLLALMATKSSLNTLADDNKMQAMIDKAINDLKNPKTVETVVGPSTLDVQERNVDRSLRMPIQRPSATPGTGLLLEDLRLRTLTPNQ